MDKVLFFLFIINSVIVHMIGLNLFLDKTNFEFKRIKIYGVCIICISLIATTKCIDMELCIMCLAICIANSFYRAELFERIWTNLFVVTAVYLITCGDRVFIAKYLYNLQLDEVGNQILIQVRILIEVCILYMTLKQLSLFKRKVHLIEKMTTPKCIIISFSGILIVYVGYIFKSLYFKQYYRFENMSYLIYIFVLMVCVTVIIFAVKQEHKDSYYKWKHKYMVQQLERQVEYYNKLEEVNKQTRGIKHDMNNHMIVINSLLESKELDKLNEYIAEITKSINHLENIISTGNTIVDAILNEKLQITKKMNIKVECEFNLDKSLDLEDVELCIIFSNTIDNAIEACDKVEETKRFIKIKAICDRGYLIYSIRNSANKKVDLYRNKKGYTSKKDSINHGFGMNNIIHSIEKNNGRYEILSDETSFSLEIDVPLLNRK